MNKAFSDLFSQQVTRGEFLVKVGILLLALTGLPGIWRALSRKNPKSGGGYGSSRYGH